MTDTFDVIIVGGGAVGASALYYLTRHGLSNVLLLEQQSSFGRGATGAWGSLVRIFHISDTTSQRAVDSVPHFLQFERETGYPCGFTRTGALYFLHRADREAIQLKVDALNRGALRLELIEASDGRRRFPAFQWSVDDLAVYESHGGYANPSTLTGSWIQAAQDRGARAQTGVRVNKLWVEGDEVVGVTTDAGDTWRCKQLVIAAGAWSGGLLEAVGVSLLIIPQVIQVNEFFQAGKDLTAPFFIDRHHDTFGRPSQDGTLLAGVITDLASDQPRFVQHLSLQEANEAKRRISCRLNWIKNASLKGGIRAVEGYTEDGNGILQYMDRYRNVLVAAGWSCTGFTLSPWIGQQIASMISSGSPPSGQGAGAPQSAGRGADDASRRALSP